MRPAFDSTIQAAAFALLLLLLLAAPVLAGKRFLPPREQAYASEGWNWGPYPWDQKQIFDETNDIDIAFIGSSHMSYGIDTPYVQAKLDERLGQKTVVRTFGWRGDGFDALYFITRDLLAHRRVKTLVFYDENFSRQPNHMVHHWFRYGDDATALAGLSVRNKAFYYFAAMVGMPRNLLELWTPNLPEDPATAGPNVYETVFHTDNLEKRLGSLNCRECIDPVLGAFGPFTAFTPKTGITTADICLQTSNQGSNFVFLTHAMPDWQSHFARQFGRLAKAYGVQLVLLHLPVMAERNSPVITESCYWPDLLETQVAMLGVPAGRLFAGLSESEVDKLYFDPVHFNLNGQEYFTKLITPALLQLYESQHNR